MIAANRVGLCSNTVVADDFINNAYLMCDGVSNALPNTHATLSATIVFPSSGSGVIIIESPSLTTTSTQPTSRTSTGTVTLTSAPNTTPTSSLSSTFATTTFSSTTRSTRSLSATSSTTAGLNNPPAAEQTGGAAAAITLSNGQIIGISIGIAGAIALALIAIFLARRTRRRNFPDFDDGRVPYEKDQKKEKVADRMSRVFHISPPIFRFSRPLNSQQGYAGYQNIDRNTIGVAISRPRSTATTRRLSKQSPAAANTGLQALSNELSSMQATPQTASSDGWRPAKVLKERPASRLLPAKPTLTLAIPPPVATRTASSQPPLTDRTSTLTNNTAFADLDSAAVEGAVWRPPPSDPQSATALYVADRWGNWVLNNKNNSGGSDSSPAVPPLPVNTAQQKRIAAQARSPTRLETVTGRSNARVTGQVSPPARPPPAFLLVDPKNNTAVRASSVYSQTSAARPPVRPPYPPASRSNSSSNKGGSKSRNVRSNSEVSNDSATTIDTEFETSFDEERDSEEAAPRDGHLSNLSPVVERMSPSPVSPAAPHGGSSKSPVQNAFQPAQTRLDGGGTVRLVPPASTRAANFGGISSSSSKRMSDPQRDPMVFPERIMLPGPVVPDTPGAYPEPLRPRRAASRPGERTRPSPRMQQLAQGQFQPTQQQLQPQRARYYPAPQSQQSQQQQFQQQQHQYRSQPQQSQYHYHQQQQYQQQHQYQQRQKQLQPPHPPRLNTQFTEDPNRHGLGPLGAAAQQQQQLRSPHSAVTTSSTASSLLAKRVGSDRAAALALDPNAAGRRQPWRRQDGAPGGFLSPDDAGLATPLGTGMLPMTPGWRPRLTPTRRGDDLYLNVQ
ncbi:cell wall integrity and stress response component [Microdochium nivale]|nr:cell wall integrity and stress response component [Microdochium nivale]